VGSIADCAIDGTGAKLPTVPAANSDNDPMSFILVPLGGGFARLPASAPPVRLLNMVFIDVLHLLIKSPCESMIDAYSSVLIGIDIRTHAISCLCDRVRVRMAGFGYRKFE
jgi:hypothetical protein